MLEDPSKPHAASTTVMPSEGFEAIKSLVTVLLLNRTSNDVVYQFTFKLNSDEISGKKGVSDTAAERFITALQKSGIKKEIKGTFAFTK